jgi:acyl-CoA thioesterase FadM
MQVFIEDTDAYGVVYNTNYVRAYERALHWFGESSPAASELLRKQDWSTVKVDKQRFKKSHALGGDFVVTGTRKSQSATLEVWELEMANQESGTIYNSAVITIGTELPSPPPLDCDGALSPMAGSFLLYRDEFDINLHGRLPLRNVMNPFERSRSNGLGGPDTLRRLQEEDGLIFVVTSVDEAALIHNDGVLCRPGSTVTVTTVVQIKRRGIMRFLHTMWADDDSGVPHRVAQAVVVLMTLDAATRKPTSAIPDWLKEKLSGMGRKEMS